VALDGLGEPVFNPYLEDGGRLADDETAGLALAATIAGADVDDADFNPFAGDSEITPEVEEVAFNPFLADASEEG
jgi:hypothetical protein